MTYEKAKELQELLKPHLTDYVERITEHSKNNKKNYVCPICQSGAGKNKTGGFSITKDGLAYHCFSCGAKGDLIELIGDHEHITNYYEKIKKACDLFNIPIDDDKQEKKKASEIKQTPEVIKPKEIIPAPEPKQETDYTDYFLQAHNNLSKTDYLQKRGLSTEILNRFNIGYDENWRHPEKPDSIPTKSIIIPTSNTSYSARDTAKNPKVKYKKTKQVIFNLKTLETATKPVFLVEGELDALSIMDVGGEAVALGSTSMYQQFIDYIKINKPKIPIILSLDTDKAGKDTTQRIEQQLQGLEINIIKLNVSGTYKDPNEALQKEKEVFKNRVIEAEKEAEQTAKDKETSKKTDYIMLSAGCKIDNFLETIKENSEKKTIKTAFTLLDKNLGGGLHSGLYFIGAISSLGKTTFVLQIADNIAKAGNDVLIFSLEMSESELMAKSISRETFIHNKDTAKTTREILNGGYYKNFTDKEKSSIDKALISYGLYAKHIYIKEGTGNIGVDEIKNQISEHQLYTGNTPVIIIDYLQILSPAGDGLSDKQNIDKTVLELKRISRDFKTPVIAISSFNRASYSLGAKMEAFKESGAIEYSSDVLLGLQFQSDNDNTDTEKAKRKEVRTVQLVILKNRNGASGVKINYNYQTKYNFFTDEKQGE